MGIFFVGRLLLFIKYYDDISQSGVDYWLTFLYGLRLDTISASALLLIPLLLLSFSHKKMYTFIKVVFKYYFLVILSLVLYIENATFPFIAQYDVRPNYLFVEYLEYPKEVFSMIFSAYKLELFISFVMISSFIYLYLKKEEKSIETILEVHYVKRAFLFIPLFALLFMGFRSSFGHRPANGSDAMYTTNRMVNEITKNSIYSISYSIYSNNVHQNNAIKHYGKMDIPEAIKRVQKRLNIVGADSAFPLSRIEKTHFKGKEPKNLVIFIQESMGYQFVHALGGEEGITPNMNRLSKEGILLSDLYSNGTRSIRGLAGVSAGNFSVPGKGVLSRNKSQDNFFTLATVLKEFNYHTTFMYGGESRFDNMKGWYIGNGFDEVIDQPMFKNPTFVAPWGVCDEDLVVRANKEFKEMYAKKQKFATVMFSQSNHSPFEYPNEKIDVLSGVPIKSVKNAVKYADYAIGKFIELARAEAYYKDTIIVIVADHNVRTYGKDMVPVDMYHIPGLILGGGIQPMVHDAITTQPDLLATALDLIGLDLMYPIMGHSIFSDKKQNISLMQFYDSYALRVGNKVAIVRPNKEASTFLYEEPTEYFDRSYHLTPIEHDKELEKDALAFVITLDYVYNEKLYRNAKEATK
ncbi:LTA synthase family protein [Sulfurimonas sp. SAG-AH-194-I05]|nr:LTA synthase family protein [Sulfurimonas sp. SAG-AH-194-I05]